MLVPEIDFFALADGMGGHKAGEVASKEAITFITYAVEEMLLTQETPWSADEMVDHLRVIYEDTNSWVYSLARTSSDRKGMGTTLCSLLFYQGMLFFGNVGDSRIYRLREGTLTQLSFDHSLHNKLMLEGRESEIEKNSKNVLTMAIGTSLEIQPQIEVASPLSSDVYLLCSDGLSDYVQDSSIEEILKGSGDLSAKASSLIEEAKAQGSSDNISVVLVHCI